MPDPTEAAKTNEASTIGQILGSMGGRSMNADTAQVVSAWLSHNTCQPGDIPGLIASVHAAFSGLSGRAAPVAAPAPKQEPAVPIKKSVFPDYIVCLEDGKEMKMLKRHLMTAYGLSPDDYRKKWGLPVDYPMVAPEYAKTRSSLAKEAGLGRKREPATEGTAPAAEAAPPKQPVRVLRAPKKAKKGAKAAT